MEVDHQMKLANKCLRDITLAEVNAEGFLSMGSFIDGWLNLFGYWDPLQSLQSAEVRRIS